MLYLWKLKELEEKCNKKDADKENEKR